MIDWPCPCWRRVLVDCISRVCPADDGLDLPGPLLRDGQQHLFPAFVRSFNTKAASGLEFSEATTTAPVHPTMPGSSLDMDIPRNVCSLSVLHETGALHKPHEDIFPIWTPLLLEPVSALLATDPPLVTGGSVISVPPWPSEVTLKFDVV